MFLAGRSARAGLFPTGVLTVIDSQFRDNEATGGEASSGEGGAIWNSGRLVVSRSLFADNLTRDDNDIGGGGAIMNRTGMVKIDRAFFQNNSTRQHGYDGALANRSGGSMLVVNTAVSDNTSGEPSSDGGMIANVTHAGDAGRMTLNYVTLADNDGGGLVNAAYDMAYADSIIARNYENYGGPVRDYNAAVNCVNLAWPKAGPGSIVGLDGLNCRGLQYVDNSTALDVVIHPLGNNGGFAPTHALRDYAPALDAPRRISGAARAPSMWRAMVTRAATSGRSNAATTTEPAIRAGGK